MTDSLNNTAWNDWANYLLHIVKKHDGDIVSIVNELKLIGIQDEKIANILQIIKGYEGDVAEMEKNINTMQLQIQQLSLTKLNECVFDSFYAEDYKVFKTEILTQAKIKGTIWGAIMGGIVGLLLGLLNTILKIILNL